MIKNFQNLIKKYGTMQLLGSDGACACGELYLFGIHIKTHCHRTSLKSQFGECNCDYAGVHIWKEPDTEISQQELEEIGKLFQKYIKESYRCACDLIIAEAEK